MPEVRICVMLTDFAQGSKTGQFDEAAIIVRYIIGQSDGCIITSAVSAVRYAYSCCAVGKPALDTILFKDLKPQQAA